MNRDDRRDDTPIPRADEERIQRLLVKYLERADREEKEGATTSNVLSAVRTLADEVHSVAVDVRELKRWREEHERSHRTGSIYPGASPYRQPMDTGAFKVSIADLEKALEAQRAAFEAHEKRKMTEELVELRDDRKWRARKIISWIVAGVGFVLAWAFGALVGARR